MTKESQYNPLTQRTNEQNKNLIPHKPRLSFEEALKFRREQIKLQNLPEFPRISGQKRVRDEEVFYNSSSKKSRSTSENRINR